MCQSKRQDKDKRHYFHKTMDTDVKETSLLALKSLRATKHIARDQAAVIGILEEIGPTHDLRILEALNQKEKTTLKPKRQRRVWTINSVCGRRNELVELGVVFDLGPHRGIWRGRKKLYHIWKLLGDERMPAGWTPEAVIERRETRDDGQMTHLEMRQRAEEPVLAALRVTEAARTLRQRREHLKQANLQGAMLFV